MRDFNTPGSEYELNATIKWKLGAAVDEKYFDPNTVGRLSIGSDSDF
ncbi:MAG: hypothetical protein SGI77_09825 [Pirellulaceae bacterium]|nr:hypothetical protein [Pirellulaceae bacterium]